MRNFFKQLFFLLSWVYIIESAVSATAQKTPILLKAKELRHEKEYSLIIAKGSVELSDGENFVHADTITYNQKTKIVTATGNVQLFYKDGSLISADYLELEDTLKEGFIEKIYLYTRDKARFAGNYSDIHGNITTIREGVYTPCEMCAGESPTWQIKADQVERNLDEGNVVYKNATLELLNIPVFYTPYFSHVDPTIKRRSGFMPPLLGYGGTFGEVLGVPYYWDMGVDQDATITPIITTKTGQFLLGEYRKQFRMGKIHLAGSGAYTDNTNIRSNKLKHHPKSLHGHFLGQAEFHLSDHWRLKGQLHRESNQTYLKRFPFLDKKGYGAQSMLISKINLEGFYDKNYAYMRSYWLQDLRAGVNLKETPLVAPVFGYHYVGDPDKYGGFLEVDSSGLLITRTIGARVGRLSSKATWNLPYTSTMGSVFDVKLSLRGDIYDINKYQFAPGGRYLHAAIGRGIPKAYLGFRHPFITDFSKGSFVIEPMVSVVAGSYVPNSIKIPNEDSQDFEFTADNLFVADRFTGLDLIDTGQRINYGLHGLFASRHNLKADALFGQSYNFSKVGGFPINSGIRKGASDYVGRFKVSPKTNYDLAYSFRLDRKNLKVKFSRSSIIVGPSIFRVGGHYIYTTDSYFGSKLPIQHQLMTTFSSEFTENWKVSADMAYSLSRKPGALEHGGSLGYHNDCFGAELLYRRSYYRDRDVRPSSIYFLRFSFKNLGVFTTSPIFRDEGSAITKPPGAEEVGNVV